MKTKLNNLYKWILRGPFDIGVAIMMIITGISILIEPDQSVSGFMMDTYHMPMNAFGIVMIMCGVGVSFQRGLSSFAILVTPVLAYAVMAFLFFWHGLVIGQRGIGVTSVVAWGFIYWLINWVSSRRVHLVQTERLANESK